MPSADSEDSNLTASAHNSIFFLSSVARSFASLFENNVEAMVNNIATKKNAMRILDEVSTEDFISIYLYQQKPDNDQNVRCQNVYPHFSTNLQYCWL
jgi:hypothetical protein